MYWSLSVVYETKYKQGLFIFSIYSNSSNSYDWYYRYKNNVFDLIFIRSKRWNQPLKCLKQNYLLCLNDFLFLQFSIKLSCVHIVTWIFQNAYSRCKYKLYGRLWSLFWIKYILLTILCIELTEVSSSKLFITFPSSISLIIDYFLEEL